MMVKSGSFESPKPYLFALYLKNSIIPLLTSVRTSLKVPIYYIKGVLMILNRTPLYVIPNKWEGTLGSLHVTCMFIRYFGVGIWKALNKTFDRISTHFQCQRSIFKISDAF